VIDRFRTGEIVSDLARAAKSGRVAMLEPRATDSMKASGQNRNK
jgi:hypothetical protein